MKANVFTKFGEYFEFSNKLFNNNIISLKDQNFVHKTVEIIGEIH